MSFELRVFFDGLIAYVVADEGDPPPVTAYLVSDQDHYPFLLHASQQVAGNCTHDEALNLFNDLNLMDPPASFRACRFSAFTEIAIEELNQQLDYTDSGCDGCPHQGNRDWFCWVPRISEVADESIQAKSPSELESHSAAAVKLTQGHLKTFAFAAYGFKIVRFKAKVKGGLPASNFSRAAAEITVLEVPVSNNSVKIQVGEEELELRPSGSSQQVDVVVGNLPPLDSVQTSGWYADHFSHFYSLGHKNPTYTHIPYRDWPNHCGLEGIANPADAPPLIQAMRVRRGAWPRYSFEPPICPQGRF